VRIAIVSTYSPRPCGIAVFSSDLRSALLETSSAVDVGIASIVRHTNGDQPPEVVTTIRQDVMTDYAAAAADLSSWADVVLIEHEFGIFGGDAGEFVLTLARGLTVPLVVTLHTVLSEPSIEQASVLRELCQQAAMVTVFTETARRMVIEGGLVTSAQVKVVPHGAPDLLTAAQRWGAEGGSTPGSRAVGITDQTRTLMDRLEGRTVLATFGLISPSKGLELAIEAMPSIVALRPNACYLIAGQTHPEVVQQEGERYRDRLERLVRDLELTDHVFFLNRFLGVAELAVLLARTDLYLTPYPSREQIVSGALTFAVAAGCPVVSTPYLYAEDLLGTGAGLLVPFGDSSALAAAASELLASPARLAAARAEARRIGTGLSWRSIGEATVHVLAGAAGARNEMGRPRAARLSRPGHGSGPSLSLSGRCR
jgi:glycosyltransferase involved in cell wall biosynthesis